jgi:antitoxin component YwqK of YwqJK toxin-antitoxin module
MRLVVSLLLLSLALLSCKNKSTHNAKELLEIDNAKPSVEATYPDGKAKKVVYNDEKNNKVAEVDYHSNGNRYKEWHYQEGIKNGESFSYYEDGTMWSLNTYKNDLLNGPYKTFHPNGQPAIVGQYENGYEEGEWMFYYDNGKLNTLGTYESGNKKGVWLSYSLEGQLVSEYDYSKSRE